MVRRDVEFVFIQAVLSPDQSLLVLAEGSRPPHETGTDLDFQDARAGSTVYISLFDL